MHCRFFFSVPISISVPVPILYLFLLVVGYEKKITLLTDIGIYLIMSFLTKFWSFVVCSVCGSVWFSYCFLVILFVCHMLLRVDIFCVCLLLYIRYFKILAIRPPKPIYVVLFLFLFLLLISFLMLDSTFYCFRDAFYYFYLSCYYTHNYLLVLSVVVVCNVLVCFLILEATACI